MKRWISLEFPYQRVLDSPHISVENKQFYQVVYEDLDPF